MAPFRPAVMAPFRPVQHRETLERLRGAARQWMRETIDLGLLPEPELRSRFGERAPHAAVRSDPAIYPQARILAAAELAGEMQERNLPKLQQLLTDDDSAVRYWAATGLLALGPGAAPARAALEQSLRDPSPSVRITSAEALAGLGSASAALPVLAAALQEGNEWTRLQAVNAIDRLDAAAESIWPAVRAIRPDKNNYVNRVIDHILK